MFKDLVLKCRSYRRFHQEEKIELDTLKELVDLARLSASGGNQQPLKYLLSSDPKKNAVIAPFVGIGGNPPEGERPSAYIIILGDKKIREGGFGCDHGIAAQSIMLGATEKGLGGVIVGNVKRDELRPALSIPEHLEILLALAIGKPKETAVIDSIGQDGVLRGYWDDQKVRHVPKRTLTDIIVG